MNKTKTALLVSAAVLGGTLVGSFSPVRAQLGGLFRGAITIGLVDKLAGPINSFVNTITGSKPDGVQEENKVVPILSIGQGTYAGAVQVTGPKNLVDQVKAVGELTAKKRIGTDVQVRALIPISTRSVTNLGSLSRVKGVGVSAIIDLKL